MSIRGVAIVGLLANFVIAPAVCAQSVHEHPGERIDSAPTNASGDLPDTAKAVTSIIEKTNAFRMEEKREKVKVNAKLTETARYFADFMATTGKYGHTADDQSPADRAKKHGYDYCIVLENIAYQYRSDGFTTAQLGEGFFEGWKNSPGHRRNMLDADVTETGVAISRSEKTGYYYAVQMFGGPKSLAIEFSLNNQTTSDVKYRIGDNKYTLPPSYIRTHERCRPESMTVQLSAVEKEGKGESKTVTPVSKDRFVITKGPAGYLLQKE